MNQPMISKRRRPVAPEVGDGSNIPVPDEVVLFQILVRLPVKSLLRFKSVCKAWHATIASAHFARLHLELSRATSSSSSSMAVIPRQYQPEPKKLASAFVHIYSFQPPLPHQRRVAKLIFGSKPRPNGIPSFSMPLHCDGLVLLPCVTGHIFVCNPATKELVELPRGTRNASPALDLDQRVAFGFDPSSGMYKVARHFLRSYTKGQRYTEYDIGHEVLTLGVGDGGKEKKLEWKATIDPPYPIQARTPICLPGFFYWSAVQSVADADKGKLATDVILRFSMRDGTFTVHPNPPCRSYLSPNDLMCELGGKLCYVHSPFAHEAFIWLAQDDGQNNKITWSLRCRVFLPIPRDLRVFACASADQDTVFLSVDAQYLFKCNLNDGSVQIVVGMSYGLTYDHGKGVNFILGSYPFAHYMVPYVESLLRIGPC